jgi:hypothetical protein
MPLENQQNILLHSKALNLDYRAAHYGVVYLRHSREYHIMF